MAGISENDLAALLPGRDVVCKGETITVMPLYFGQYPTAGKLARPLVMALATSGVFGVKEVTDEAGKKSVEMALSDGWIASLPTILADGGEAMMAFFAFAIKKPRDWFDDLMADEGFELAEAILRENYDFFVRRVLPMLQKAGLLKVSATTDGAASLPASLQPATDGQTSSTTP